MKKKIPSIREMSNELCSIASASNFIGTSWLAAFTLTGSGLVEGNSHEQVGLSVLFGAAVAVGLAYSSCKARLNNPENDTPIASSH